MGALVRFPHPSQMRHLSCAPPSAVLEYVGQLCRHLELLDVGKAAQQARGLPPTKRQIVNLVGKIYNLLGLLAPVVIRLKCLFQELCECKLKWDEPLTRLLLSKWESMVTDLQAGPPTITLVCSAADMTRSQCKEGTGVEATSVWDNLLHELKGGPTLDLLGRQGVETVCPEPHN